jgi:ATP-dependent RNA helicase DeaD
VETLEQLEAALTGEDVGAYLLVLETLFEQHDPAEVAAAAVALLRKKGAAGPRPGGGWKRAPATPGGMAASGPAPGPSWTRLFLSVGQRDGAGPGDILGAITGEARVDASAVGRIDLKDTFSIVEVESSLAEAVIAALNGTTVRGRSLRADYDRGGRGPRPPSRGRRGSSRPRGGSGPPPGKPRG